jgi:hypothetical protein
MRFEVQLITGPTARSTRLRPDGPLGHYYAEAQELARLANPNLTLRAKKRLRTTAETTALAHPPG